MAPRQRRLRGETSAARLGEEWRCGFEFQLQYAPFALKLQQQNVRALAPERRAALPL
jgi:hypothetical protein